MQNRPLDEKASPAVRRIPFELLLRIFTIGCETEVILGYDRFNGRGTMPHHPLLSTAANNNRKRPKPFTKLVSRVCSVWRSVTIANCSQHLWYAYATFNPSRWSLAWSNDTDCSITFAEFHSTLERSGNCDLVVGLGWSWVRDSRMGRDWSLTSPVVVRFRLLLHCLNSLRKHKDRIIAFHLSISSSIAYYFLLKFISEMDSWPRLEWIDVSHHSTEPPDPNIVNLSDMTPLDLYLQKQKIEEQVTPFPSLMYVRSVEFPLRDLHHFVNGRNLKYLTVYASPDEEQTDFPWSKLSGMLVSSLNLEYLELSLLRQRLSFPKSVPSTAAIYPSRIRHLQLSSEIAVIKRLLSEFSFDFLENLRLEFNASWDLYEDETADVPTINLPSLSKLHVIPRTAHEVQFWQRFKHPTLEVFEFDQRFLFNSVDSFPIRSPKTLHLTLLNDQDMSNALYSVDMSDTTVLYLNMIRRSVDLKPIEVVFPPSGSPQARGMLSNLTSIHTDHIHPLTLFRWLSNFDAPQLSEVTGRFYWAFTARLIKSNDRDIHSVDMLTASLASDLSVFSHESFTGLGTLVIQFGPGHEPKGHSHTKNLLALLRQLSIVAVAPDAPLEALPRFPNLETITFSTEEISAIIGSLREFEAALRGVVEERRALGLPLKQVVVRFRDKEYVGK